jgi:putative ABC transport system permease protein
MTAILRKISADLRRRRLQTLIIALVVVLASGTATLALTLLLSSNDAYNQAFAQQRGGHVLQEFSGAHATPAQIGATAHLPAVASSAGPWIAADVTFEQVNVPPDERALVAQYGLPKFGVHLVGRADPGGPVDDLRIVSGRWPRTAGEIAVTRSFAQAQGLAIGDSLVGLVGRVNRPRVTVVGEVIDVDEMDAANQNPQHAWVLPRGFSRFLPPGQGADEEMAYRFHRASTAADLRAGLAQIQRALPAGALGFTRSYLDIRDNFNVTNSLILTFLLAFSVFALGAAALIIANIVTGVVIAGYREIGIMKSIGYTPMQVLQVLVGQMLVPALAGTAIGIPLGVLLAGPMLSQSADAVGLPAPSALSIPTVLLVVAGVVLVVCLSAGLPAARAGLLSPVRAIVTGSAPGSTGRRARLLRCLNRGGSALATFLPQALRLGVAQSFVRPLRAAFTLVAVLVGIATVTFAFGIRATLDRGLHDGSLTGGTYQIEVQRIGSLSDARMMRLLRSQPEMKAVVARDWASVAVDGLAQPVQAIFTRGDAGALDQRQTGGRWYAAPGEAVAPAAFLREAHLHVGQYFTGSINGRRMRFHLVGTIFDTSEFGRILHMDFSTLAAAMPGEVPSDYAVRLRPGTDPQAFALRLLRSARDSITFNIRSDSSSTISAINFVVAILALVLGVIAAAAVFNTVLLNTRERIGDTAVLKAVGMAPRQTIVMVATSAAVLGLLGAIIGLPVGMKLHDVILNTMAAQIGNDVPNIHYQVYGPGILLVLALSGILVAIAGAYLPARWAARTSVATVLHAE